MKILPTAKYLMILTCSIAVFGCVSTSDVQAVRTVVSEVEPLVEKIDEATSIEKIEALSTMVAGAAPLIEAANKIASNAVEASISAPLPQIQEPNRETLKEVLTGAPESSRSWGSGDSGSFGTNYERGDGYYLYDYSCRDGLDLKRQGKLASRTGTDEININFVISRKIDEKLIVDDSGKFKLGWIDFRGDRMDYGDVAYNFYGGIGARGSRDTTSGDIILVPDTGSPAEKAGVKEGDRLIAIDGEDVTGMSTADSAEKIRGPSGSPVTLTIKRDSRQEMTNITVMREKNLQTRDKTIETGLDNYWVVYKLPEKSGDPNFYCAIFVTVIDSDLGGEPVFVDINPWADSGKQDTWIVDSGNAAPFSPEQIIEELLQVEVDVVSDEQKGQQRLVERTSNFQTGVDVEATGLTGKGCVIEVEHNDDEHTLGISDPSLSIEVGDKVLLNHEAFSSPSDEDRTSFTLQFLNDMNTPVNIFWIDFDGNEVLYFKNIPPGRDSTVFTYINHLWVVRDMEGACVESFVIENYSDQDESFGALIHSYTSVVPIDGVKADSNIPPPERLVLNDEVKSDVKDDVNEPPVPDTADLENEISSLDEQILLLNQQIEDFPEENKNIEDPEWDNTLITLIDNLDLLDVQISEAENVLLSIDVFITDPKDPNGQIQNPEYTASDKALAELSMKKVGVQEQYDRHIRTEKATVTNPEFESLAVQLTELKEVYNSKISQLNELTVSVKEVTEKDSVEIREGTAPSSSIMPDSNLARAISQALGVGEPEELFELYVGISNIKDLTGIGQYPNIRILVLSDNKIENGWEDLKYLTKLKELSIEQTGLNDKTFSYVSSILSADTIRTLSVGRNKITDATPLAEYTGLTGLWMGETYVSDVRPIGELKKLGFIYLADNEITDISPLAELPSLFHLDLSDNMIEDISPFVHAPSIGILELDNNNIRDITPFIDRAVQGGRMDYGVNLLGNPLDPITSRDVIDRLSVAFPQFTVQYQKRW